MSQELRKKVTLLGLWGAGKTSLVSQFVNQEFTEKYHATLGVKTDTKQLEVQGKQLKMVIWDVAGSEENARVPMHYATGSAGYLLVLDGTRKESIEQGLDLAKRVNSHIGHLPSTVIVNKNDLDWVVSPDEISQMLGPDTTWLSASAKTGEGVEDAFIDLAVKLVNI